MKIHHLNYGSRRHAVVKASGRKKAPFCHMKELPDQGRYLHYTKGYRRVSRART